MDIDSRNEASQPLFLNKSDSNSIFQIPPHLLKSYGPGVPSNATLRVDESGKKWKVSIEKFMGHYFFTDGWKEFAEQADLKALDFLVLTSESTSKQNGTNKEKTRRGVKVTRSSIQNKNKDKHSRVETKLSFTKTIMEYNRYRMDIPMSFILRTGLRKEDIIKLVDHEGREYPVRLQKHRRTFSLRAGWGDFVIDNKVMVGSTISLAWLHGKTLQAEIVKMGTDQPAFSTANRRAKRLQDSEF